MQPDAALCSLMQPDAAVDPSSRQLWIRVLHNAHATLQRAVALKEKPPRSV